MRDNISILLNKECDGWNQLAFPETVVWDPDVRETFDSEINRSRQVLTDLLNASSRMKDESKIFSLTAHSGSFYAFQGAVNSEFAVDLGTGKAVIMCIAASKFPITNLSDDLLNFQRHYNQFKKNTFEIVR